MDDGKIVTVGESPFGKHRKPFQKNSTGADDWWV